MSCPEPLLPYEKSYIKIGAKNKMELCRHKDVFGKPNEGVHSLRIFGVAAVDLVATILAAAAISYLTKRNFFLVFLLLMLAAIAAHRAFCVNTALNVALGLRVN